MWYGDLLLLFVLCDVYENFMVKVLVMLVWLDEYVVFEFVFKVDDDFFVWLDVLLVELCVCDFVCCCCFYWGFFLGCGCVKFGGCWCEVVW